MAIDRSLKTLVEHIINKSIKRDECFPTVWDVYEEVMWNLCKDIKEDDKDNLYYISVRELYQEVLHVTI